MCPSAFFMSLKSNAEVHTESRSGPFIWITKVDCSNSVKADRVQVLGYIKYSLLVLPLVGIEPATSWWFHNETPYPLRHLSEHSKL